MSIIDRKTVTCSVCGHKQTVRYARSLFGAGSPELDGKPPWLLRSSMPVWVHKCHRCGFAAYCLEGGDRSLRMFIVSPAYVFCACREVLSAGDTGFASGGDIVCLPRISARRVGVR